MPSSQLLNLRRVFAVLAALALALGISSAAAQFPPSTVYGSVTDSAGPVEAGLAVEAYIGDKLCGKGFTEFTGDGDAKVTVYSADVVTREQTAGCGFDGAEVRIKIGDRFAAQTASWRPGPVQLNLTFGNATPAAIPTFTPTPARTATPVPGSETATPGTATQSPVGTIPAGSPGAGSPVATLAGGLTSSTPGPGRSADEASGGFPVWAIVVLGLGGIAVVGGGIGYAMSRSNRPDEADDDWARP